MTEQEEEIVVSDEGAEMNLVLNSVFLKGQENFSFFMILERPDLNDSQYDHDGFYSIELPDHLNPKLMYVSSPDDTEPQSGTMCYRPTYPHECAVTLDPDHGESETFLVKVLFEDGSYAAQEITVPIPEPLQEPEIYSPTELPDGNSNFEISFEDVGADIYSAEVIICGEYQNDGIDPCLNTDKYLISKRGGQWVMDEFYTFYNPVFEVSDEVVDISSEFIIELADSLEYEVYASKETLVQDETGRDIPATVEVRNYILLQ